jgi:hypothetical protein
MRTHFVLLGLTLLAWIAGCAPEAGSPESGGAAIVGRLVPSDGSAKTRALSQDGDCADLLVAINAAPALVVFDQDCGFVVAGVTPSDRVELRVELTALGVSGAVEIREVADGELIEIEVEARDDSLTIVVIRRTRPAASDTLPTVISGNNVSIQIGAGRYAQVLMVEGNNFTLVGRAGEDCDDDGWSEIEGAVVVLGNNAAFRNIAFAGGVEVRGNNAHFINCCFDGELVIFGNGSKITSE